MEKQVYHCPKCGCTSFEHDQFQATGGTMAKLFDIQNEKIHHRFLYKLWVYRAVPFRDIHRRECAGFSDQRLSFG